MRAHGTYSIKIVDPLKFYAEAVPKNKDHVEIDEINEQYLSEFLEALQSSVNQMSADGFRISFVSSKARELGKYMSSVLDEEWNQTRGMEIQAVGMTVSYSEESQKLLNMRNEGAMLSDPTVREGYVQGAVARGLEAAGSNSNGSMAGFMGMGMASNISGGMMGAASNVNLQQMQMMNGGAGAGMTQGGDACGISCWAGGTANIGRAGPVHVDSRIRENSVPIVENRHRKPSGPVAVDRLTVEISAPTAESRERKNRGQIPDTSCKIDVLMVESFK